MTNLLTNSEQGYGWITIILHCALAVSIFGLFALGLYMTSLDYYDAWYHKGPDLHRSIGVVVFTFFVVWYIWRLANVRPKSLSNHRQWEIISASIAHNLFYALILCMTASGYLITTADGQPLKVFELLEIPALISTIDNLEDTAGVIHLYLAWTTIILAIIHATGALKHHLLDGDETLLRMLGLVKNP